MIRASDINDLDALMAIWLSANISAHSFIAPSYWRDSLVKVRGLLPKADLFVFHDKKTIQGFIGIYENHYIAGLFVAPQWQSSGIGRQLLEYAQLHYQRLTLDCYVKNHRAVSFYQRNDFVTKAEKINQPTGEREYSMEWQREHAPS